MINRAQLLEQMPARLCLRQPFAALLSMFVAISFSISSMPMVSAQGAGSQATGGISQPGGANQTAQPSANPLGSTSRSAGIRPTTTPVPLPAPGTSNSTQPGILRLQPSPAASSEGHLLNSTPTNTKSSESSLTKGLMNAKYRQPIDFARSHDQNSVISQDDLRLHSSLKPDAFKAIRLEISYDQTITLEEALRYALDNNLAIKISRENYNYQNYVLYGQVANLLPNLTMGYNLTNTDIFNTHVDSNATVFLTRVSYPVFQGGSVVQGILGQYYRAKGWHQAFKASFSDEVLDIYQKYNAVLLNRALLQIRAKAVEVSEEQLRINKSAEASGTGTRLAVAQAVAQLASDRQALLQQQVTMRTSALALNFTMNFPMAVNLVPVEELIKEKDLFQSDATMDALVSLALQNRPELREYEDFKVAAARNIAVAAAPLYPQVSFFTQFSYADTLAHQTLSSQAAAAAAASAASTAGAATGTSTAGAGVFGGLFQTYQQGLAVVWSLNNLGLTSVANIYAAQSLNRQSQIQANQELQTVIQQVHSDYLTWHAAREQIDNAALGVRASEEELRIAQVRLRSDVGTNLEVIQGQRDYINSLSTQVTAIVNSNNAQAQLLHDTGLISSDTILHGFKGSIR